MVYVEVACGADHSVARRSDGVVIGWGDNRGGRYDVPALPAGMTWRQLGGALYGSSGRYSAASTYAPLGAGCPGTLPASRLVVRDTPRIGEELAVRLFDLPQDVALFVTGWSSQVSGLGPLPLPLDALGLPGCTAFVSDDSVELLVGSGGQAVYRLAIPDVAALVGAEFHQQAVVLDAGANAAGAVMSAAATARVGD